MRQRAAESDTGHRQSSPAAHPIRQCDSSSTADHADCDGGAGQSAPLEEVATPYSASSSATTGSRSWCATRHGAWASANPEQRETVMRVVSRVDDRGQRLFQQLEPVRRTGDERVRVTPNWLAGRGAGAGWHPGRTRGGAPSFCATRHQAASPRDHGFGIGSILSFRQRTSAIHKAISEDTPKHSNTQLGVFPGGPRARWPCSTQRPVQHLAVVRGPLSSTLPTTMLTWQRSVDEGDSSSSAVDSRSQPPGLRLASIDYRRRPCVHGGCRTQCPGSRDTVRAKCLKMLTRRRRGHTLAPLTSSRCWR